MAVEDFFTKLDSFAEYWQIRLKNYVKEMTSFTYMYGTFHFFYAVWTMNATAMF